MPPPNGTPRESKRLLRVTAGNLRQIHLHVNGHHDFFPPDCTGGRKRSAAGCRTVDVFLDGLNQTVTTDIGCSCKIRQAASVSSLRRVAAAILPTSCRETGRVSRS